MSAFWAVLAAALLAGCGYVSFRKPPTDQEIRTRAELREYYEGVQRAFAAGNSQALASMFDASITKPMSKPQIEKWAEDFFKEHGRAAFRVVKLELDELGPGRAVATLTYKVETPSGKGSFGGTVRDELVKRHGRWYMTAWEKID